MVATIIAILILVVWVLAAYWIQQALFGEFECARDSKTTRWITRLTQTLVLAILLPFGGLVICAGTYYLFRFLIDALTSLGL